MKSSQLRVLNEINLNELLGDQSKEKKNEASGVVFVNKKIYVVFDNYSEVARINLNLNEAQLLGNKKKGIGYEGIAYNHINEEFYLVEESVNNKGKWNARLTITNNEFVPKSKERWLKHNFEKDNKGFEGLTFVVKDNKTYILALCEGNDCEAGKGSKIYGAGRIIVFQKKKKKWKYTTSIKLPQTLEFIDYSGMDLNSDNALAITSQESSAIWIGRLNLKSWTIVDDGAVYNFPKDKQENKLYCNIEGVAWITNDQLVVVSDAKKSDQPIQCKQKEQSIHIVSIEDA